MRGVFAATALSVSFVLAVLGGCGAEGLADSAEATTAAATSAPDVTQAGVAVPAPAPVPRGFTRGEIRKLLQQILWRKQDTILYAELAYPYNGTPISHVCQEFVTYDMPALADSRTNGTSGQLVVVTVTTWRKPYQNVQLIAGKCGLGRGHRVGATTRVRETYPITKWDSGWKIGT